MSSIIYVLTNSSRPAGGISVMLQHVELLHKHGFSTFALGNRNFESWVETSAPIIRNGEGGWACPKGSILILPETVDKAFVDLFNGRPDVQRVVFCQSYRGIDIKDGALMNVAAYRIDRVFANSELVSRIITDKTIFKNPPIVPCSVDTTVYRPGIKKLSVAYMPSKLPEAKDKITANIKYDTKDIEWIAIQGKSQAETAQLLSKAAIFLNLGYREGFGLPPLEAMASGCIVVGFHAEGAKVYANSRNGMWHDEDDFTGCAASIDRAVEIYNKCDHEYYEMVNNGLLTAKNTE